MRIQDEIRKNGYFWLPDSAEGKVPGTLTISDGGEIQLETIGFLDEESMFSRQGGFLRIIGEVENEGYITLENCFYEKNQVHIRGSINH